MFPLSKRKLSRFINLAKQSLYGRVHIHSYNDIRIWGLGNIGEWDLKISEYASKQHALSCTSTTNRRFFMRLHTEGNSQARLQIRVKTRQAGSSASLKP
jgi:hypothetical protein